MTNADINAETVIDISSYTSTSNMYTFPSDGYLLLVANIGGYAAKAGLYGNNGNTVGTLIAISTSSIVDRNMVYVRKGMKVYLQTSDSYATMFFTPISS